MSMNELLKSTVFACGALGALMPCLAFAQADVSSEPAIETVTVTAERREENLQKVPLSVSAITSGTLAQTGIQSTADLAAAVPSLVVNSLRGAFEPFIRGVGTGSPNPGEEGTISTYVDGVLYSSMYGSLLALNNVERVEVLKGPQG